MTMRRFLPLAVFAVAFAVVEAGVVVYLRELLYPEGFSFPLRRIPDEILRMELWREAATLAVLGSVGAVAGRTGWQKFSFFMFAFGLWDIFYYVWLKVFLGWPESLFTPDVLFLLPVVWWGPVLAPMIVAASLCAASIVIVHMEERGLVFHARFLDIAGVTAGALVILYTFMVDAPLIEAGRKPPPFRWGLFFLGEAMGASMFIRMLKRGDA